MFDTKYVSDADTNYMALASFRSMTSVDTVVASVDTVVASVDTAVASVDTAVASVDTTAVAFDAASVRLPFAVLRTFSNSFYLLEVVTLPLVLAVVFAVVLETRHV